MGIFYSICLYLEILYYWKVLLLDTFAYEK